MKTEQKRYFLVEYYGINRVTEVNTYEEVEDLLRKVKNYNNRKSSNFLIGNIKVVNKNNKYILTAHLYKKYTDRLKISELDDYTSKFCEDELITIFSSVSKMKNGYKPDINIAYFETENKDENGYVEYKQGIKYIPILYKDDLKYINPKYIRSCLYYHTSIKDFDFFKEMVNEFSPYHFINDEKSKLLEIIDKCEHQNLDLMCLYNASDNLFKKFICEYEKDESLTRLDKGEYQISRRRLRDFGFFIKNYNIRSSKINSPLKYNKNIKDEYFIEENGQLKLKLK